MLNKRSGGCGHKGLSLHYDTSMGICIAIGLRPYLQLVGCLKCS